MKYMAANGTSPARGSGLPSRKTPLLEIFRVNGKPSMIPAASIPGIERTLSSNGAGTGGRAPRRSPARRNRKDSDRGMLRVESKIQAKRVLQASHHENASDQQDHGESHLRGDQNIAQVQSAKFFRRRFVLDRAQPGWRAWIAAPAPSRTEAR